VKLGRLGPLLGVLSLSSAAGTGMLVILAAGAQGQASALPLWGAATLGTALALATGIYQGAALEKRFRDIESKSASLVGRASNTSKDTLEALNSDLSDLATMLQRRERELRSEQVLSSMILSAMQEGILVLDQERRISLMNPTLREMLLVTNEAIGRSFIEVVRHAPLQELLRQVKADHSAVGEIELGGVKPRHLLVRISRLSQRSNDLLAVFVDVTELRRLESLRRDFVANVSHELRTPVTGLVSATETLRGALAKDPSVALKFVDIIERNAERLRLLIEDILDLSKIESREYNFRKEPVRLRIFLERVATLFRERADKRTIRFELVADESAMIELDRNALEQIVSNLVDNAVKYANEGATVTLRATLDETATVVSVEDNGPGIDSKHLPRLFERFYRVDAGRARGQGGTGLGLAIAKHLAEAMEGSLYVESELGRGTRFDLRWPTLKPAPLD
jgi:two-component system, OmpR family, phosphate regulon sensor histidine kinase PhoR